MTLMNRTITMFASSLALAAAMTAAPAHADTAPPSESADTASLAARADTGSPAARAAELYRQATRLYAARRLSEAEPLYRRAWELQQSYDIASNLGALELELGEPRLAAELLAHALANFPARGRGEERAAIEARFAAARKLVGTLRVTVGVAGAEVRLDGRPVGRAPLPSEIFVTPGAHVVEASFPGYADMRLELRATPGVTLAVRLPLAPPAPPAPPPRRSAVPVIVGASLGLASAVAGAVLLGTSHRADTLHDSIQRAGQSCAMASPGCSDLHAAAALSDRLGNAGVAALGIAGALAAGTVAYVVWPGAKLRAPAVRASFGITPAGGAALLTGSF
jgi:hypothetical protein